MAADPKQVEELHGEGESPVARQARPRRKGIYLLPNLFTTGALFAAFYAIVSGMNGNFETAAVAIFVAGILDGLDGRVARLTNTQSDFGAELDSLSDMVAFGVAPALVAFSWSVSMLGKIGWMAAFIYIAGCALRLARFNTQIETADPNYFTGLPSPTAAALVAGLVWVGADLGISGDATGVAVLATIWTAVAGGLMVSNFKYNSFKKLDLRGRVPFVVMLAIVLGLSVVMLHPPSVLLCIAVAYSLSAPLTAALRWARGARAGS